jgi:hypothetical protein
MEFYFLKSVFLLKKILTFKKSENLKLYTGKIKSNKMEKKRKKLIKIIIQQL